MSHQTRTEDLIREAQREEYGALETDAAEQAGEALAVADEQITYADQVNQRCAQVGCRNRATVDGLCIPHARSMGEATLARQSARDVADLAQLVHSAVAVSDAHGGLLSPAITARYLRNAFPEMDDTAYAIAVDIASEARGRTLEGAPAVPPF